MMKKFTAIILAMVLLFSLTACGNSQTPPASSESAQSSAVSDGNSQLSEVSSEAVQTTDFPKSTITIICPWAVGGGGDVVCRIMAELLGKELGTNVIVENITGSGGQVGTIQYMDANPDGYTLLFASDVLLYLTPRVMEIDYDPDMLQTICTLFTNGYGLIVNPNSGITNLAELKAHADANGPLTCGVMGLTGAINYEIMNALFTKMDIAVEFMVFGSGAEVATEVLGGHIDMAIAVNPLCDQYLQEGSLNYIASFLADGYEVEGCERVPSTTEQGYDVTTANPNILCVKSDTPDEVVDILSQAMKNISGDLAEKMAELRYNPYILFDAELETYMDGLDKAYALMAEGR